MKLYFDDLVVNRLVQIRRHDSLPLNLYKYHRKVFYKGLFEHDRRLRWARGIVLDEDNNVVLRPFYKWYNYGENNAGDDWNPNDYVLAVRKHNGFMMSVTRYNGELLYASSGTFDSDYVGLGRHYIEIQCDLSMLEEGQTFVFEICAKEDPHIVEETPGAYLIGIHHNNALSKLGYVQGNDPQIHQQWIAIVADRIGAFSARSMVCSFGYLSAVLPEVKHEGYMVYNLSRPIDEVSEPVVKLKSPYYLTTKLLARHKLHKGSEPKWDVLQRRVDEEFYDVVQWLKNHPDFFNLDEQSRIEYLTNYVYKGIGK